MTTNRVDGWLTSVVAAHFVISLVHGYAHDGGRVLLSPAQSLFVYLVILAGPLAGLALSFASRRAGGLVVSIAMAGSLAFGIVNHFVIASPDHVTHVAPEWRLLFTTTAVLLAMSESFGVLAGLRAARKTIPT